MGKLEAGNVDQTVGYTDAYSETDVAIVTSVWGDDVDYMNKVLIDNQIVDFRYVLIKRFPQIEI